MSKTLIIIATYVSISALSGAAFANSSLENGARFYKKCAACHLPTGAGVPGSFPPLNTENMHSFYKTEKGRNYLTLAIDTGLQGPITVNGRKYRGLMPAQGRGKKPQDIADVLNYMLDTFFLESPAIKFTVEEIENIRASAGKISRKAVLALRPEEKTPAPQR